MKRLLNIELQKIWKNKASRILTISYFLLLASIALISTINFKFIGIDFKMADMGIFNFPFIWHFNTYMAAILKFFLAIIIVSMMANEYSYGTLKQNLIDGMSKQEFVLSKCYTVVLFAFTSTVFVFLMTLILGLCFSNYTEIPIVFKDVSYLFAYFIKLIGFFSICLFLGIFVKRSAFAIGFLFVWFVLEKIIFQLLKAFVFSESVSEKIYTFFPLESMSNLIVEPVSRFKAIRTLQNQVAPLAEIKDYGVHFSTILIVLVWSFIFVYASYRILKKRDL